MNSLTKSCGIVLNQCMKLKKTESCLIITDSKLIRIGNALYKSSLKITNNSKLIKIPIPESHGSEPQENVEKEMLNYGVILMPTTKSLSHTTARKNASKNGARIASMPGITEYMMKRALNVDFSKIKSINEKLIAKLKNKNIIKITTKLGTDIEFNIQSRKWKPDDGIYTKKGDFGNLPAGEIFIAPLEGKTSGKIICDTSVGGLGKADKNIEIIVKNGFIENIKGGKIAAKFEKLLKSRLYRNAAELGIGTNPKAKITGEVLEDEKVLGTCHIAFGNNRHFGGKVDVPFHVDFVIKNPDICAGNTSIMKNGKFINFI